MTNGVIGSIRRMPMPESSFSARQTGHSIYGFERLQWPSTTEGLFFAVDGRLRGKPRQLAINRIHRSAYEYGKKNNSKFSCRAVEGGIMVYRTV